MLPAPGNRAWWLCVTVRDGFGRRGRGWAFGRLWELGGAEILAKRRTGLRYSRQSCNVYA